MSTEADIVERASQCATAMQAFAVGSPHLFSDREALALWFKTVLQHEQTDAARTERERCAKVAETFFTPNILEHVGTKRAIAAEIRSLPDSAVPADPVVATSGKDAT